jgi:hypothetical protein
MKENKVNRTRFVGLRFRGDEYEKLEERKKKTTCTDMSDYLRRVLLNKPITGYVRNRSLDEFMEELMHLRKELNHIGYNFNQAVKKLHTCDTESEIKTWLLLNGKGNDSLLTKMEQIKKKMDSIADQWLQ